MAEVSAELEPVIALLADTQEQVSHVRSDAEREAERRRQQAVVRATALVASAHRDAAADRADAASRVSRRVEEENVAALAEAERGANTVRLTAAERMPSYLERVINATREVLHAGEGARR